MVILKPSWVSCAAEFVFSLFLFCSVSFHFVLFWGSDMCFSFLMVKVL